MSQTDVTVMFSKDDVKSFPLILFNQGAQFFFSGRSGRLKTVVCSQGREQEQVSSDQASCDDHSTADLQCLDQLMSHDCTMRVRLCPVTELSGFDHELARFDNAGLTSPAMTKSVGVPAPDGTINHRFGCFSKRPIPPSPWCGGSRRSNEAMTLFK